MKIKYLEPKEAKKFSLIFLVAYAVMFAIVILLIDNKIGILMPFTFAYLLILITFNAFTIVNVSELEIEIKTLFIFKYKINKNEILNIEIKDNNKYKGMGFGLKWLPKTSLFLPNKFENVLSIQTASKIYIIGGTLDEVSTLLESIQK